MDPQKMKWRVESRSTGYDVVCVGEYSWCICHVCKALPGDIFGTSTSQYICDIHNKALEGDDNEQE